MRRVHDQTDAFIATGRAHILLTAAFSNLPKLRTIGIRDYNGKGRWRDGESTMWRSYGWSSGEVPLNDRRHLMSPETILPLILHSFDEASTGLERIEVFLRRHRLPDASFDITPDFMRSKAVPVLSKLKALLLSIEDRGIEMDDVLGYRGRIKRDESAFRNLKVFLQHTPLLEHLRLNFAQGRMPSWRVDDFLAWLGTSPGPQMPVILNHLNTLELGMIDIAPHTLLGLFSKFTKLETVSLWKIALQPVSSAGQDYDEKSTWSYYLSKIGQSFQTPENVKEFMIGWITETPIPDTVHSTVRFAGKTNIDCNGKRTFEDVEDVVKYRKRVGTDVSMWLDELAEKAFLPPRDVSPSDSSATDDTDDDDEDEGSEDMDDNEDDGEDE
jgi:hypothetical protein